MPAAFSSEPLVLVLFIGLLSWAALSDALHYTIPNSVTLSLLILYPAHVIASSRPVDWAGALLVTAIVFVLGLAIFSRGIAGGGDVKLLTATSLWVGPAYFPLFLIVMGFSGALLALIVLIARHARRLRMAGGGAADVTEDATHERVPYGVAISVGGAYVGLTLLLGS